MHRPKTRQTITPNRNKIQNKYGFEILGLTDLAPYRDTRIVTNADSVDMSTIKMPHFEAG